MNESYIDDDELSEYLHKKSEVLKPCPKCGSAHVRMMSRDTIVGRIFKVACEECGISMEELRDSERLVKRWNE